MTKILKSRYAVYKNFEEDVTGHFLFKMKRREVTRKLFSYLKVLNRVEPLRLADLLIRRKKKIKGLPSFDKTRFFKLRYFYGIGFGKTKQFNKLQYRLLQRYLSNRTLLSLSSLEARLDVLLVRLRLFNFIKDARDFIKTEGVLINKLVIKNFSYVLVKGDILSFRSKYRMILKRKVYRLLRACPIGIPFSNCVTRELNSVLTIYTWLFKRYTKLSPFFIFGFPRYIEPNFNSMEFYFYGSIYSKDIYYPFKTTLQERSAFFNSFI